MNIRIRNKALELTTGSVAFFTGSAKIFYNVTSVIFANKTGSNVAVDLTFYDAAAATTFYITKGEVVAANGRLELSSTYFPILNLRDGDKISALAASNSAVDCLITVDEQPAGVVS